MKALGLGPAHLRGSRVRGGPPIGVPCRPAFEEFAAALTITLPAAGSRADPCRPVAGHRTPVLSIDESGGGLRPVLVRRRSLWARSGVRWRCPGRRGGAVVTRMGDMALLGLEGLERSATRPSAGRERRKGGSGWLSVGWGGHRGVYRELVQTDRPSDADGATT
ncbi:hypothetical protein GCM10020218_035860 [Dactylosporangium vinaceum]